MQESPRSSGRVLWPLLLILAACGRSASESVAASPAVLAGEALVASHGCVNCHAAPEGAESRVAPSAVPSLEHVGKRMTLAGVKSRILAPRSSAAGGPLCAANASPTEALALAKWLTEDDDPGPIKATEVLPHEVEAGRLLFNSIGCRACHDGTGAKGGLDVDALSGEVSIPMLESQLLSGGAHPDFGLSEDEARRLSVFLLAADRVTFERQSGLRYEYYEADDFPGPEPDWDAMQAVSTGLTDAIGIGVAQREDQFGVRLTGAVSVPVDGLYTFFLTSDDGSYLDLAGTRVIDHGGLHGGWTNEGTIELKAGVHPIVVSMFERTGDEELKLEFEAPGVERREFKPEELFFDHAEFKPAGDPALEEAAASASGGSDLFTAKGCVACHAGPGIEATAQKAKPLSELRSGAGCLPSSTPSLAEGMARYAYLGANRSASAAETSALAAYLDSTAKPEGDLDADELLARELPRLGCLSCHERGGEGGPSKIARPFFGQKYDGDDLGDEGHFPPSLTGVGAKLQTSWMADVISKGTRGGAGVRPYLATEMPRYEADVAQKLAGALTASDARPSEESAPAFSEESMELGRKLVGTGGFACIVCHTTAGKPSLGIPMIDLATVPKRLRYAWFQDWVREPTQIRPKTRMAGFWPGGKSARTDILGGEAEPQIAAIWTYLSLGVSMPLPDGLNLDPAAYDLEPHGRPIYHACFLAGASARGLAVGFPARKHLAFDQDNVRLDALWYGSFVNAADTWEGRAGGLVVPAGEGVLRMPGGVAVAALATSDAAWPESGRRELGWRYLGHRRDSAGVPTFRYAKDGLVVEESLKPEFGAGGRFVRHFHFSGLEAERWSLRLGDAKSILPGEEPGVWELSGEGLVDGQPDATLRIDVKGGEPVVRSDPGDPKLHELILTLVPNANQELDIEVNLQW